MLLARFSPLVLAGLTLAAVSLPAWADPLPTKPDPRLVPVFKADRLWNGIAITPGGRAFVSFPSSDGPGVGLEELSADGIGHAYPDLEWNSWKQGQDPKNAFVRVNSLRIGPDGALWIVDAGAPGIGKPAVPGGARLIRFDLATNKVTRIYDLSAMVKPMTYVDDLRFNGKTIYLTDAGEPGLGVMEMDSGKVRRVLDHDPSTTDLRPMRADGKVLHTEDGGELKAHADQLEVSPDGKYLYYMPASGPTARIETRWLDDPAVSPVDLARHVEPNWADTPTTGGTAIDANGTIYLNDADKRSIVTISPEGKIATLISDPRLIWGDAMWIDQAGFLWVPANQQNLTPGFNGGKSELKYPVWIYKMQIGAKPAPNDHP